MLENYTSFMDRANIFFGREDVIKVSLAYKMAKFHHRWQTRKEIDEETGKPKRYFEHVRQTALIVLDELAIPLPELVIGSLLHDLYEDTIVNIEEIEFIFGREVCLMIKLMSKKPKDGFHKRLVDFADWKVLTVKGCDRLQNLRSMQGVSQEFITKQVNETRGMYYPLMDLLVEKTSISAPTYLNNVKKLRDKIRDVNESLIEYYNQRG